VSRMTHTPTGIDAEAVPIATVHLPEKTYQRWGTVADAHAAIIDRIREQPGVIAAGGSNFLPLEVGWRMPFQVLGTAAPARPEDLPQAQIHSVSEGYFEAMGASIARGRAFSRSDTVDAAPVVIVNESFARRYLSGRQAVG